MVGNLEIANHSATLFLKGIVLVACLTNSMTLCDAGGAIIYSGFREIFFCMIFEFPHLPFAILANNNKFFRSLGINRFSAFWAYIFGQMLRNNWGYAMCFIFTRIPIERFLTIRATKNIHWHFFHGTILQGMVSKN